MLMQQGPRHEGKFRDRIEALEVPFLHRLLVHILLPARYVTDFP